MIKYYLQFTEDGFVHYECELPEGITKEIVGKFVDFLRNSNLITDNENIQIKGRIFNG